MTDRLIVPCEPRPGVHLLAASRLSTLQILAWAAVGTGTLMAVTGPPINPHVADTLAAAVWWPVGPGVGFAVAGGLLAWSLWRGWRVGLVVAGVVLAALYALLSVGFAVQAWEHVQAGRAPGFVYPIAVYASLAALHAVQADTTARHMRLRRERRS